MRVVILNWKSRIDNSLEIFSTLKLLCESYPKYSYNTMNNYLSKKKLVYEDDEVRIERKVVNTTSIPARKIELVGKKVERRGYDEEAQNRQYWLSQPVSERLGTKYRWVHIS